MTGQRLSVLCGIMLRPCLVPGMKSVPQNPPLHSICLRGARSLSQPGVSVSRPHPQCCWPEPCIHVAIEAVEAEGLIFQPFIHVTNMEPQLCAGTMPILTGGTAIDKTDVHLSSGRLAGDSS